MNTRGIGKRNEAKMKEYLKRSGKEIPVIEPSGKKIKDKGRPGRKVRLDRPEKSAAKRTLPGEERYVITLKAEQIRLMKYIAEMKGVKLKEVYGEAVAQYLKGLGSSM